MRWRHFLAIVELRTKAVSASTFILGLLYSLWSGARPRPSTLVLAFIATLLVDMGTTAFNSFFDWWRGTDRAETNREADKVLVHEGAPALAALLIGLGLYAGAGILGLVLALRAGAWVIGAGLASLLVGFLYSGGPWPISRTPLGELAAGGFLGSVLFLIVVGLSGGRADWRAVCASLPGAAMIAAVLAVNNACDRKEDRAAGRRTFAVIAGEGAARAYALAWMALAFLGAAALSVSHNLPWAAGAGAALALVPAVPMARAMLARGFGASTKTANMGAVVGILLSWSLGLGLGLALAIFLPL